MSLLTTNGKFSSEKHPKNSDGRETDSTEDEKLASVNALGLRQDMSQPPMLVQHPDPTRTEETLRLSWGHRLAAVKKEWQKLVE